MSEIKKRRKEMKDRAADEKKQGASSGNAALNKSFQRRSFNLANVLYARSDSSSSSPSTSSTSSSSPSSRLEDRYSALMHYEDPSTVSPETFFANKPMLDEAMPAPPPSGRARRF
jgi:hypothetical protein